MSDLPELDEILEEVIQDRISDIRVCVVCKVQSVDKSKGTVDCVPQHKIPLQSEDGSWVFESLPTLSGVPVAQVIMGPWSFKVPVEEGSFVTVLFNDFDLGPWRTTGSVVDPEDFGVHTMTGGIALPLSVQTEAQGSIPDDMTLGHSSTPVVLTSSHVSVGGDSDSAALASLVNILWTAFMTAGPVSTDGGAAIQTAVKLAATNAGISTTTPDLSSSKLKVGG